MGVPGPVMHGTPMSANTLLTSTYILAVRGDSV
jgi:hypothetical protein